MGYIPQESLENTTNTMGTLLGLHLIVPWFEIFPKVGIDEDLNHRNVLEFSLESARSAFFPWFFITFWTKLGPLQMDDL